jgi:Fe-S cluster assembly protein SufD
MTTVSATPHLVEEGESATAPWLADWERFVQGRRGAEPAELLKLRQAAIERFGVLGFPTTRQEEWRFTNVAPIARTAFRRAEAGAAHAPHGPQTRETQQSHQTPQTAAALAELLSGLSFAGGGKAAAGSAAAGLAATERSAAGLAAAVQLVFVDGHFSPRLSTAGELPPGVVIDSLGAVLAREPRRVMAHLARYSPPVAGTRQPFVALNTAFFADGAYLELPRGVVLEQPVELVFLSTGAGAVPGVAHPRNLIVLGEASQATVVETYAGRSGIYFTNVVTEVAAGPAAVLDHYKLQRESRDAFHMATFQLHGDRGGNLSSHSISLGGGLVRNDVNTVLDGPGIECILNGLYLADGRQLVDHHMRVEHAKPHCASHELFKGILDGKARSVFNGLIYVHPGAQKTDAKQSNRNLLLSADAIANSNPQLEIFADDVRCTHGSTVGQLDADAVFYLRSRGIGEDAARSLLTYAFASDIVQRIKVEPLRRHLEEFLFARLPRGEVVRQAV